MRNESAFLAPFRHVDSDRLRRLRGVVFDIDDTVTRHGQLEPVALDAIHRLAAAGLTLVAVTGRPLGWADVLGRLLPVQAAIGENGAGWVVREGEALRPSYFADDDERTRHRTLLENVRARVARDMPDVKVTGDQHLRRCDLTFDVGETVQMPADRVAELVTLIESEGASSAVSSVHAHAVPGAWDKALGARRALAELKVDLAASKDRWLFIGDSGNDAAAFAYFPISVGVRNVEDHLHRLPSPPRYITDADRGRGFAEMAMRVLGARPGARSS